MENADTPVTDVASPAAPEVKPDPLEPVKAQIRAFIAGKDLASLPGFVAFKEMNLEGVTPRQFELAWHGVLAESRE